MRQEKKLLLNEMKEKAESFNSMIVASYQGLNAGLIAQLRKTILRAEGELEVVKKRVFLKALQSLKVDLKQDRLDGHVSIIFGKGDPIELAKKVYDFKKKNENTLNVLCAHIEGAYYPSEDVDRLSELPSKDEMRAQFVGLLEAPLVQTVGAMNAILTSLLHCIENKNQQES